MCIHMNYACMHSRTHLELIVVRLCILLCLDTQTLGDVAPDVCSAIFNSPEHAYPDCTQTCNDIQMHAETDS
jgi:hypothetical protein